MGPRLRGDDGRNAVLLYCNWYLWTSADNYYLYGISPKGNCLFP